MAHAPVSYLQYWQWSCRSLLHQVTMVRWWYKQSPQFIKPIFPLLLMVGQLQKGFYFVASWMAALVRCTILVQPWIFFWYRNKGQHPSTHQEPAQTLWGVHTGMWGPYKLLSHIMKLGSACDLYFLSSILNTALNGFMILVHIRCYVIFFLNKLCNAK